MSVILSVAKDPRTLQATLHSPIFSPRGVLKEKFASVVLAPAPWGFFARLRMTDVGECPNLYSFTFRNRNEFKITDTELKLMAAAARIGLRRQPKNGYSTPAAMGTPSTL